MSDRTAPEAGSLLDVSDLSLAFGGVKALTSITLDVPHGKVTGLIGPNGAGKTSFFNCISRLYTPDSGSIVLDGTTDLLALRPNEIAAHGIARTFQNLSLCDSLTVEQNVLLGAHHRLSSGFLASAGALRRERRAEAAVRAEVGEILALMGLTSLSDTVIKGLSYGTLKRVEIARAIAARPRLILLDEPAGGLSHGEVDELAELLLTIAADVAVGLLLIDHHMGFVMKVSDHVHCLDYGRVIASGSPKQIQSDPHVIEAYLGTAA